MRAAARVLTTGCLVALFVLLGHSAGAAHTDLVASFPADEERLDSVPGQVVLEFSVPLRGPGTVGVRDPAGLAHPIEIRRSLHGDVLMGAMEPEGADGEWRIDYRVVAKDGHVVTGSVPFSVGNAVLASPSGPGAGEIGGLVVSIVLMLAIGVAGLTSAFTDR